MSLSNPSRGGKKGRNIKGKNICQVCQSLTELWTCVGQQLAEFNQTWQTLDFGRLFGGKIVNVAKMLSLRRCRSRKIFQNSLSNRAEKEDDGCKQQRRCSRERALHGHIHVYSYVYSSPDVGIQTSCMRILICRPEPCRIRYVPDSARVNMSQTPPVSRL